MVFLLGLFTPVSPEAITFFWFSIVLRGQKFNMKQYWLIYFIPYWSVASRPFPDPEGGRINTSSEISSPLDREIFSNLRDVRDTG